MNADTIVKGCVPKHRIKNCTPHEVSLIAGSLLDPGTGYRVGGHTVITFPPCGNVATVTSSLSARDPINVDGVIIPIGLQTPATLSPLPEGADFYIVSNIYLQAAKDIGLDTSRLLVPYEKVRHNGKVIGCAGLISA